MQALHPVQMDWSIPTNPCSAMRLAPVGQTGTQGASLQWLQRSLYMKSFGRGHCHCVSSVTRHRE